MAYNLVNKQVKIIPEWNDNKESETPIEIVLKPLKTKTYWEAMAVCQKAQADDGKIDFKIMAEIPEALRSVCGEGIVSMANLTIDEKPLKPINIVDYPALLSLVTEIVLKLIEISTITSEDKKK